MLKSSSEGSHSSAMLSKLQARRSAYFLFAKMLAVRVDPLLPPQPTNMTLRKVADV